MLSQANVARVFISQLFTAGIAQEWIIRQVAHATRRTIDERYVKKDFRSCNRHGAICIGTIGGF